MANTLFLCGAAWLVTSVICSIGIGKWLHAMEQDEMIRFHGERQINQDVAEHQSSISEIVNNRSEMEQS